MDLKRNAERFTGQSYVSLYDDYRPEPPQDNILQGLKYLGVEKADFILDLGCGTGLSTRVLSAYGNNIIGIEPSEEMLTVARAKTKAKHISYQQGFAHDTGIASNSVDLVTCSQSFHWMEPKSTLKEIDRVLKDTGVLLIYDVIWPPSTNYDYEMAYKKLFANVDRLTQKLDEKIAYKWEKHNHLNNIEQSGIFSYVKETYYHKTEAFNTDTFIGIALSQGGLEALLKRGFSEDEIGITAFKKAIQTATTPCDTLTYNYRVIFGTRKP
ncbi:class I SAM-dependent methyltransferase [Winogradskyella vincentii]|uniref:Class I SAM-dependent methyltransferase n=1 Tax=Winogradskyella vincentii TaxID=2877122 RepID=A0ABS7Y3C3_9FLAO|nr:class I SAM-dependent methyltransferase [Winogradskyella vincentii]MCA0153765.1 class I SAM-dependent methyltransferase [Winogradskyella vincentii]